MERLLLRLHGGSKADDGPEKRARTPRHEGLSIPLRSPALHLRKGAPSGVGAARRKRDRLAGHPGLRGRLRKRKNLAREQLMNIEQLGLLELLLNM